MNKRILNLLEEVIIEASEMDKKILAGSAYYDQKCQDEPTLGNEFKKVDFECKAGNHYQKRAENRRKALGSLLKQVKNLEHTYKHGNSKQAGEDQKNAMITQGVKKNLENSYNKS